MLKTVMKEKMETQFIILALICIILASCKLDPKTADDSAMTQVFTTPLGKEIVIAEPSQKMLDLFEIAKRDYQADPNNADNIIWYGRRVAYLTKYDEAISIFSEGIQKFPNDARMYRHRGHRYISLRKYDEAIADFTKAAGLIEGTENEIEQDGLPNAQNTPVSSLHGNIWYHLGLAYYLKQDFVNAYKAYVNCRNSHSNDDNIVSSTHWLYMIQRRLGNESLANEMLEPIKDSMNIIENFSYHDLCKFYKGINKKESFIEGAAPAQDAVKYGLANWEFYNGNRDKAKNMLEDILSSNSWNSFGYIAAESDYLKYFKE